MEGSECYNIPAFLRKTPSSQPDQYRGESPASRPGHRKVKETIALTPYRQVMETFLKALDGWSINELVGYKTLPRTFDDLAKRLPATVMQSLLALGNEQYAEEDIVLAFLASLIPVGEQIGVSRHLLRSLRHACKNTPQSGTLSDSMKAVLTA